MAIFNRKKQTKNETEQPQQKQMTLDEQMMRRQSDKKPTVEGEARKLLDRLRGGRSDGMPQGGITNGFDAVKQKITDKHVQEADKILMKYKEGKANLEQRIVENEQWYKLRHWDCMEKKSKQQVQPTSAWLFNCIANKHADAMDNFPAPNILPREEGDKEEAQMLTSIVPVVLDQCEFEQVYSDVWNYKLKTGTGVYGVFWDKEKHNGLGDISIVKCDLINLFWKSGISDIQKSPNLFHVELADNDTLLSAYPQLEGKLGGSSDKNVKKYIYDDSVDTNNMSAVVDWYYKRMQNGRQVLHYCKYCNGVVLYASENDPNFAERGWYDHAMYPFVFDTLYSVEGTPAGFGFIDIGKSPQEYIDRGNQAVMKNMLANAKPRYFVRKDGSVNEEEYADTDKEFIHVDGNLGQDSIYPVQGNVLNNIFVEVLNGKIDELKETTGNRDISTGGTTSGVTAASAIAAMQEAGSKLSRDNSKTAYRAFRKICLMVIELIRQFYDTQRCFRIMGENGAAQYIQYSNARIKPQHQGFELGMDMGYRQPLFDIEVTAQKQSPYSKMAQNELALQFYSAGFFNPQPPWPDQALACLDMMNFDRKEFIMQKISQNGTMYQQLLMMQQQMLAMAQIVDKHEGSNLSEQIATSILGGSPVAQTSSNMNSDTNAKETEALGGEEKESSTTKKARQRVAESTDPT